MKTRDYYFDNLKAFLIIFVIIGNSLEHAQPSCLNTHYFLLVLYMFHMPLFTFVSGYFCTKSKRTTQEKVIKIFKIYLGVQIFYFLLNKFVFSSSLTLEFFTPQWTMWYLLSLIFWYILSDYIKDKKKWLILSLIVSLAIGFDDSVGSYASVSRTFFFLPYFVAGMMFKKEYLEKLKNYRIHLLLSSIVVLFVLYLLKDGTMLELLFEYTKYGFYYDNRLFPFFIRIFHYIGSFILGGLILSFIPSKATKLHTIGQNSLIMYVCHGAVIKLLYITPLVNYSTPFRIVLSEITILLVLFIITLGYVKAKSMYKSKKIIDNNTFTRPS
ncbi:MULTISPECIES: acyltransferase family protein [Clostridium]|uniref:acyltransferase family protein n=1 Tax=Clostridium TaxID=1485 RepID=UPI00241F0A29|nr:MULTISPECIES: acyltransferase family protein [Clostridium]MDB2084971.1 acyltransferase family protein [Clostridium paraputrificum]MDB2113518.1 acyltransferase family protein [Clostridium paraputrificum]MDU1034209.1 acyltransferase family protein [Clostridium sp.]MDU2283073.1 acyltransferase family protein [Clostridium sp.]MDU3411476.1 acyltransferase family protein [Clostridium sp.]